MRIGGLIAVLCLALAAGCAADQSIFEDRSDEVKLKHRVPNK